MSGHSYDNPCPNCGKPMNCYSDHKPFDMTSAECLYCGFYHSPKTGYLTLKELNEIRKEYCYDNCIKTLKPLKKLPKQEFEY